MAEKKFKCTYFDVCPNQDKIIMESETDFEGGEYYCTCGERSKLEEIKEKNTAKNIAIPVVIVIVLGLIIWGAIALFTSSGAKEDLAQEEPKEVDITPKPETTEPEVISEDNDLIADELIKIGDNTNYSLAERDKMINPALSTFFSSPAYVKRVGDNGTIVETLTAEEYLFRLAGLISLDKVEIVKVLENEEDGKIRELIVQEHYATSIN